VPFAVNVVGSISGVLAVDPVTIANPNDFTFDQWNFVTIQLPEPGHRRSILERKDKGVEDVGGLFA
jgi:hypothetical protein